MARRGLTTLGQSIDRITSPALRRRGFAEAAIVTRWDEIVGRPLCDHSRPFRVVFPRGERRGGTLHLTVSGAFAPEVEHLSPQIVERINTYFGYRAVDRLTLHHGRIDQRSGAKAGEWAGAGAAATPDAGTAETIAGVADPGLRAALARLAGARAARDPRKD
jgi:hypothetical protein